MLAFEQFNYPKAKGLKRSKKKSSSLVFKNISMAQCNGNEWKGC